MPAKPIASEAEKAQLRRDILEATGQLYRPGGAADPVRSTLQTIVPNELAGRWHYVRAVRYGGVSTYALLRAIIEEWVTAQEAEL